jgi:hypothetical protein
LESENSYSKRHSRKSQELFLTKKHKFFEKYDAAQDNIDVILNKPSVQFNKIENHIKNAIHNMKKEIQKKEEVTVRVNSIQPRINKLSSSPNLKFFFTNKKTKTKKKKKTSQKPEHFKGSLVTKETFILNDNSFKKEMNKKRNKSFDYNGHIKKKILKRIRDKMSKKYKSNKTLKENNASFSDETDHINDYIGYSLSPTSKFFFVFDFLLIIADLYTFVIIPLGVAQNHDIRERISIATEIIQYTIDLLFLLDFFICLFKGYYDYKMKIIRNNKLILKNYLKKYFFSDLLQAIPLFTIIRITMKPKKKFYLGYSEIETTIITFLLFIKPTKIFKIIKKKQNKALEDFYSYLSESYYLEQLASFLIYFLIFFLFIHLFNCLHIYFVY